MADQNPAIDTRQKFVEAWNNTMIDIWQEKLVYWKVRDTDELYHSTRALPVDADGRFYNITLSQYFREYGIWQDLGTGREKAIGNVGDIGNLTKRGKPRKLREPRRWYSTKYYSSAMKIRDFLAESLGDEFVGMFSRLDADELRKNSEYYRRKGLS